MRLSALAILSLVNCVRGQSIYSTGVDAAHSPLPRFKLDSHWCVKVPSVLPPNDPNTYWATYANYHPAWVQNDSASQWLFFFPNALAVASSWPNGEYFYRTSFDLTGYDPTTLRISGSYSTDNQLARVLINGKPVLGMTNPDVLAYTHMTAFFIAHTVLQPQPPDPPISVCQTQYCFEPGGITLNAGLNELTFVVVNTGGPTGFRVLLNAAAAAPLGTVPKNPPDQTCPAAH
jgi:hypothetical protein